MTVAELSSIDLFFIVVSAVIFGSSFAAISFFAVMRYSRAETAGQRPKAFPDIVLTLFAFALCAYGMWRAGLFG